VFKTNPKLLHIVSKLNSLQFFLKLLGKRDYSLAELLQKADMQDLDKTEIHDAVKYLTSKNFINDQRIASNLINHYASSKGKRWILQRCMSKQINENDFELAWQEYQESQEETEQYLDLKKKIMQKYNLTSFENLTPQLLNKIFNYLAYRGFNPNEIIKGWKEKKY